MRVQASGVSVDLPRGWEGEIGRGGVLAPQDLSRRPTVAHFANFPLPASRADFGVEVVEQMRAGDAFVTLFEYGSESAGTALFAHEGIPRVAPRDFDRNTLQRPLPGQSGLQRFFTVNGRPFCLYVVLGSHIDRADAVGSINQLLDSLVIE